MKNNGEKTKEINQTKFKKKTSRNKPILVKSKENVELILTYQSLSLALALESHIYSPITLPILAFLSIAFHSHICMCSIFL